MSSASFMDILTDKLLSYSMKMKGEYSKPIGSSYLMSDNSKLFHDNLLNGLVGDPNFNSDRINSEIPLQQTFGLFGGNYSFNFPNIFRPFSPRLSSLIVDSYRYAHSSSESPLLSDKMLVSLMNESYFVNSMNKVLMASDTNRDLKRDSVRKEVSLPPVNIAAKVSMDLTQAKMKDKVSSKCNLPNSSTLNKELTNRKTKEMHKRSKKRRRRQKKNQQSDCNSSTSVSDEETNSCTTSVTSLYLVSGSPELGCTVALSHSLCHPSNVMSSFLVPVGCASDDDSEWEPYEVNQCDDVPLADKNEEKNSKSSSISSHSEKTSESISPLRKDCGIIKATSFISSFIIPVESSDDDESDWDSCSADIFLETSEFECKGLFLTNLCSPQTLSSNAEFSINSTDDEETIQMKTHLKEVNKNWNKCNAGICMKSKPPKVSFAPDEALVEVFPADVCERKGEWERYGNERRRFKRKIEEIEKVLSPCLQPEHRLNVFKKLNKLTL